MLTELQTRFSKQQQGYHPNTDILEAMSETISYATAAGLAKDEKPCGLDHLADMLTSMRDMKDREKMNRWLGWAQGVVVAKGFAAIEDMKEINRRFLENQSD